MVLGLPFNNCVLSCVNVIRHTGTKYVFYIIMKIIGLELFVCLCSKNLEAVALLLEIVRIAYKEAVEDLEFGCGGIYKYKC